jgi:ChaB
MPGRDELPSTLRRSDAKAQRTWIKAHDNAVKQYGEGERAHQTAWAALERTHEKLGDRWVPKSTRGASNPPGRGTRGGRQTFGGVDYAGSTRKELYVRARHLDISGRSSMNKAELATAIARAQR